MIYVIKNEDNTIAGVTSFSKFAAGSLIPVNDAFFADYPQDCWFINSENELVLKEDAEAIKQAFLDSIAPAPEETPAE